MMMPSSTLACLVNVLFTAAQDPKVRDPEIPSQ